MSLLQEVKDIGATSAWCPVKTGKSLIAVGTKDGASGQSFDDYGGELSVYSMDLCQDNGTPKQIAKTESSSRFHCLAWGAKGPSGMGVIAGGLQNGVINVWDPKNMQNPLAKIEKHKGNVNSMAFNPHAGKDHLMATGASDHEVYIVDLNNPQKPDVYSPAGPGQGHKGEVRTVAWNSEVVHVLATAALDGACTVWSLKAKRPWAEIRDPNGAGFSAIAWSPVQGLHLLTASNDDRDPVIRLWDVRKSTIAPLAEYRGHSGGIFDISWCQTDPKFVLSCGKDSKTLLWDLYAGKPVMELSGSEADAPSTNGFGSNGFGEATFGGGGPGAGDVFGGSNSGGMPSGDTGRRYHVEFAPHDRTIFSACSFDRKVEIFSLNGGMGGSKNTKNAVAAGIPFLRAPVWSKRKCGAGFGFGGHLVSFGTQSQDAKSETQQQAGAPGPGPGVVRLTSVSEDPELAQKCTDWENKLAAAIPTAEQIQQQGLDPNVRYISSLCVALCQEKSNEAGPEINREAWKFMQVLFEQGARDQILEHLGFDMAQINTLVSSLDTRAAAAAAEAEAAASEAQAQAQAQGEQYQGDQQYQDGQQYQQQYEQQQFSQNGATFGGADNAHVFEGEMNGNAGSALDAFDEPLDQPDVGQDERIDDVPDDGGAAEEPTQSASVEEAPAAEAPHVDQVEKVTRKLSDVCLDDAEVKDANVDDVISKALLIGNFAVAVDSCMENNRFADALLLATCGGNDLWRETMQKYLDRFYDKKPYIPVLEAVALEDLGTFVRRSDLSGDKWKETLAIVLQYERSEEIPSLCEALADRLKAERNDEQAATAACLCYICAKNVDKTVEILVQQGVASTGAASRASSTAMSTSVVEITTLFKAALSPESQAAVMSMPNVMGHYVNIANVLAAEGLYNLAAKYISNVSMELAQPQYEYDEHGNAYESVPLTPEQEKSNKHAQQALELSDRLHGAHNNAVEILEFLPVRPQAFQQVEIGVAPVDVPVDPATQQQQYGDSSDYGYDQGYDQGQQQPTSQFHQQPAVQQFQQPQQQQFQQPQQPPVQQQQQFQQQQPQQQSAFQPQASQPPATPTPGQAFRPTSAAANGSSYIKENDGFGSTAGNPAAGLKYGNLSRDQAAQPYAAIGAQAGAEVWNPQQQQQQSPAATPAPEPVKRVMPPQMAPVVQSLEQHLARLAPRLTTPMDKRKLTDANKCAEALKEKLMTGGVQEDLFPEVSQLIQSIVTGDFDTAGKLRVSLTQRAPVWAEQKDWLKGITSLVVISKK